MRKIIAVVVAVLAIVIVCLLGRLVEDVKNEKIIVCQMPISGEMKVWSDAGMKWQGMGTTTEYFKTNQVWFNEATQDETSKDVRLGSDNPALPITFNDKGKGFILGSLRVQMPMNETQMLAIQTHYGSMNRLMNDLVKPNVAKAIMASGPLMSSLESVSEKRTELYAYITDQLNYGIYKTRVIEAKVVNNITNDSTIVKIAQPIEDFQAPGGFQRQEQSPFYQYGITVSQLAIADIFYEKATLDQVSKQRDAEMTIISAKAKAAEAEQMAIQIAKQGEAAAAAAKWKQEEIKATAVTQAEQEREVSRLAAERAEFDKKATIAKGQADAEAARLKVAAGLSPLEKATIEKETAIGVAEALANSKHKLVPEIMIIGDGKSNANPMEAVGLNMMMEAVDKIKSKK